MAYADDRGTLERLEDAVLSRARLSGRATWFAGIAAQPPQAPERNTTRILRRN